jgi:hypothetical protein
MLQTKFQDYTSKMTVYELNRFARYINSPLFNEDEKLKAFTAVILPFLKGNTLAAANEKEVWKQVFGMAKYNKAKFIRLLSDTVKKIEHFLVIDRFQQEKSLQYAWQLEIMNERKLHKHVPELMGLALRKHENLAKHDADFYYTGFLLQQQKNMFLENKELRSAEKNLEEVIRSLDTYYLVQKLKYCAAMLHYKNFLAVEGDIPLINEILQYLESGKFEMVPAINIYRLIILSYTDKNGDPHFAKLKELIVAHHTLFTIDEVKNMYVFAMNYCIIQINDGKSTYLKEILYLYKQALENDVLLNDGQLSQWDYKNIVTTALRVKEFKWAEQFLNDYKNRLPKEDRVNAYTFNLARYYFFVQKYDLVLRLLQEVKYNDIFYQLDSKITLLKTYYELGEWQPLDSLKDSFRILLRRKKLITPQQKANYNNLLKFSIRLFKVDVKDKPKLNALKREITLATNVADKSWLVEKVNELCPD